MFLCLLGGPGSDVVVKDFHDALARSPDTAVAVAAIKVDRLRSCTRALQTVILPRYVSLHLRLLTLHSCQHWTLIPCQLWQQCLLAGMADRWIDCDRL